MENVVTQYFFFDANINNLKPKNIKVDEKSNKNLIYCVGYETSIGVKPLYSTFNKINGYTEDYIGNECLTLTPLDKNKLENVKKL